MSLRPRTVTSNFTIAVLSVNDTPDAINDTRVVVEDSSVAAVNVLVEGTTFMDMFEPSAHCLFARDELQSRFAGWHILHLAHQNFDAPNGQVKAFSTIVAKRPG